MTAKHTVTLAMLCKKGACPEQVILFEKLFGDSVRVTRPRCLRHAADFNWSWAAHYLLSDRKAYREALAPAVKTYYEAVAVADDAYNKTCDKIGAWEARNKAVAVAGEQFNKARAVAFYTAFTS